MPPSAAFAKGEMPRAAFEEPRAGRLHPRDARGGCTAPSSIPLPTTASRKRAKISPLFLLVLSLPDSHVFFVFLGLKGCGRAPLVLGTTRRPGEPLPLSPARCPPAEDHAHDGGTAARNGTGKRGFLAFPSSSVS